MTTHPNPNRMSFGHYREHLDRGEAGLQHRMLEVLSRRRLTMPNFDPIAPKRPQSGDCLKNRGLPAPISALQEEPSPSGFREFFAVRWDVSIERLKVAESHAVNEHGSTSSRETGIDKGLDSTDIGGLRHIDLQLQHSCQTPFQSPRLGVGQSGETEEDVIEQVLHWLSTRIES
jgi:hypothetical protein